MVNDPFSQSKQWWNRPLFGEVSFVERVLGALNRQPIPELALSLHDTEWEELEKIEPTLRMLDNSQYTPEFLYFMRIKHKLEHNLDDYKGLHTFIKIFTFALKNINDFRTIKRIELDFQGKSQLELYEFIENQLNSTYDSILFQKTVNLEIDKLLKNIRNEHTHESLTAYKTSLNKIAENAIGLNLLILFKKYKVEDYSIFNVINDVLKQVKKQELTNLKSLVLVVKAHYDELDNLGQLIGIPHIEEREITYAKIMQYIALSKRHEPIIYRFQQLLDNINKWYKHYQTILEIHQEYPSHKYKLPANFTANIPGESIYWKYQEFLNNP